MDEVAGDFVNITTGLFVLFVGVISLIISLFRLSLKDFSLFNFGLFSALYGLRWLVEIPAMQTITGFPFTFPYLHGLLTYALAIPFFALLINIFGRGLYNSLLWIFYSSIIYALAAITYDLFSSEALAEASINNVVVVLWAIVSIVNVLFIKRKHDIELNVMKIVFLITLVLVTFDNIAFLRTLILGMGLEHPGFIIMLLGLGYVAVHHTSVNDRKLRTIEQEIEIARRIQQSNLPAAIYAPQGIDIVARYVPMSAVAGDFYDVRIKDDTSIGILIADVSGHGVGAALIGSMLKIAFASQADNISDPARVLTEINRILHGKLEQSFVTAFSVFIDTANKKLCYAGAGHPSPLLWRKSTNEIKRLSSGGTILGPFTNSTYQNAVIDIVTNDRLVLYTDGIIELNNRSGELFGEKRWETLVKEKSSFSAEETADQFIEHITRWSCKTGIKVLDDDLTLIIIDINLKDT
jgi:sigma-B regulation protein RsbU (phosphoserine phosphatase)